MTGWDCSLYRTTTAHLCEFKPTVKIYVLTSPGSMCSLICNTVRWHMDVSGEGEPLWPVAPLPPSLSLSLRFCLSWSLSSSSPVLPSPWTFLRPARRHCPLNSPPHPYCFSVLPTLMREARDALRYNDDDNVLENVHGNAKWSSVCTSDKQFWTIRLINDLLCNK